MTWFVGVALALSPVSGSLMCWHVVLSRLRLSDPLALSATEAVECELPCGALDVVEDASISCCREFPSWHFRGSGSHVRMGRQKLQAKRSPETTYRGDGIAQCLAFPGYSHSPL